MLRTGSSGTLLAGTILLVLGACGGGGGQPAVAAAPEVEPPLPGVAFEGIAFRTGAGELLDEPPLEQLDGWPPSVGAALDTVVVFRFSGVPAGPFDVSTLPVYTTAAQADPELGLPLDVWVPAQGSYALVGHSVEFRPAVPTWPLQAHWAAPPQSQPGLFPGCTYVAAVLDQPGHRLANLLGPGGSVTFQTSSLPDGWYPPWPAGGQPPQVVQADPPDGTADVFPALFAEAPLTGGPPAFPDGPRVFELEYAAGLLPTAANLAGQDLDGDGAPEASWFLRGRATRLLVAHEVPADALGAHEAFAALSGLHTGQAAAVDGADVLLHAGQAPPLAVSTPGLGGPVRAMSSDRDADLLWLVYADATGCRLGVADHLRGDPSYARHAESADGSSQTLPLPGLDLAALVTLDDGRLLGFDRVARRLCELRPTLTRQRPSSWQPAGPPHLLDVTVGDGASGGLATSSWPAGLEVRDLAQAPSGRLAALVAHDAGVRLVELAAVDPAGDGQAHAGDGLPTGVVLAELDPGVVAVEFLAEQRLLVLDAERDELRARTLDGGDVEIVVPALSPWPAAVVGPWSPCLAIGRLDIDLDPELLLNAADGARVRLTPTGVLPVGAELSLMQRRALRSLSGVSAISAGPSYTPQGALEWLRVRTAEPTVPGPYIDDVFLETFYDASFEDAAPVAGGLLAAWAQPEGLRASLGELPGAPLGDFLPTPPEGYDPGEGQLPVHLPGEPGLDYGLANVRTLILDTDAQPLPLADGSTPGVHEPVTVLGGHFAFRDIVIPAGVRVLARGSRPLLLTATGRIEIHGILDVSGVDGTSDMSFDSGFLPVAGGPGGPGGGRGGDGHPVTFDPNGLATLDQYATPTRGERGQGPVVTAGGAVAMAAVGGHGGLSTLGYDPGAGGYPRAPNGQPNNEHHRPPGGGGGSFRQRGRPSEPGAGVYLVESPGPFAGCPNNDKIRDALYGNDENRAAGVQPDDPLQCVFMEGVPEQPVRLKPRSPAGVAVFVDEHPGNDHVGPGGEIEALIGGQGGGAGGSRVDSMRHGLWSAGPLGQPAAVGPPWYPKLLGGVALSPSLYDAKGGAGGGAGGALRLRALGDIVIGRSGLIDASGGHGGGGEVVGNGTVSGGGGGGSGGAVLLQAGGVLRFEADADHRAAGLADVDGDLGAGIDVSGGFGRDTRTEHDLQTSLVPFRYDANRGDGGQGGFGLIQLHVAAEDLEIEAGSQLFARVRAPLKRGPWTGDAPGLQADHPDFGPGSSLPSSLRYVDLLHARSFRPEGGDGPLFEDRFRVLNGSHPPIIPLPAGAPLPEPDGAWWSEHPAGSGQVWADTRMIEHPQGSGRHVVEEPQPEWVLRSYNGWVEVHDDEGALLGTQELNNPPEHPTDPVAPGLSWQGHAIPWSLELVAPDGTPPMVGLDGVEQFDPSALVDRLPVVPPGQVAAPLSSVSQGTSRWLAFPGPGLRGRGEGGLTAPHFSAFHGTWNAAVGAVPADKEGAIRLGAPVPGLPARYVAQTGFPPFDPGLFGHGSPPDPPFNDVAAASPELGLVDAITDNARVSVLFQGAQPVRPGARVPDPGSLTAWTPDLTALAGQGLVRFQVRFDLGADPDEHPYGAKSLRPQVERVRLRARY